LEPVHQLSALDQEHGRDRADLERARDLRLLLGIDLGQQEGAVVVGRELFQDRPQRLARTAPFGPEVDQDRHLQRLLQDLGLEPPGRGIEDVGAGVDGHGAVPVRGRAGWWRRFRIPSACQEKLTSAPVDVLMFLHEVICSGQTGARDPDLQRDPPTALRTRRDDPAGAGPGLRGDAADHHRAGGRALRSVAGAGIPDRARVRGGRRGRVPLGGIVTSPDRTLALAAAAMAIVAAAGLGALLPGYSQLWHPLALPGATGVPRAPAYNLALFVLPGLALSALAWRMRARLPAGSGLGPRVGTATLLLSALAWAAQGVLPLDPEGMDAGASRLHAAAWMRWWIAFIAGATLVAWRVRGLRASTLAAWLLVPGLAVLAPQLLGAGPSQRLAVAAWFGWMWCAAGRLRD